MRGAFAAGAVAVLAAVTLVIGQGDRTYPGAGTAPIAYRPGWRSTKEKDHVYGQFEEARNVYRRLAAEAAGRRN